MCTLQSDIITLLSLCPLSHLPHVGVDAVDVKDQLVVTLGSVCLDVLNQSEREVLREGFCVKATANEVEAKMAPTVTGKTKWQSSATATLTLVMSFLSLTNDKKNGMDFISNLS